MEISKTFGFESAHSLPNVPEGHKCARVHGHSFRCVVRVQGDVGADTGWVMDFADLKAAVQPTIDALDRRPRAVRLRSEVLIKRSHYQTPRVLVRVHVPVRYM